MLLKTKMHTPVHGMCTYFGDELIYPMSKPGPGDESELNLTVERNRGKISYTSTKSDLYLSQQFCDNAISLYLNLINMPRNRLNWNKSIGRGIDRLLNREPGPSLQGSVDTSIDNSVDTSASVLQTSNLAESTQSTSNSLAASQAIHRAREHLRQFLVQIEDDEDVDCSKSTAAGNDLLCVDRVP